MEEPGVRALGRVGGRLLKPVQNAGGLLIGGCGCPDIVQEGKGRARDSVERRVIVGAGLTVVAREGIHRGVEAAGAVLDGEVETHELVEPLVMRYRG